jgi:hypothetical protein
MGALSTAMKYALCLLALGAIILLPTLIPDHKASAQPEATVAHAYSPTETEYVAGAS